MRENVKEAKEEIKRLVRSNDMELELPCVVKRRKTYRWMLRYLKRSLCRCNKYVSREGSQTDHHMADMIIEP
jgi:hypothetical protein